MRGGSKKCKPIPTPPRGGGLKSHPITFTGRGKPARDKTGRGGAKLPSLGIYSSGGENMNGKPFNESWQRIMNLDLILVFGKILCIKCEDWWEWGANKVRFFRSYWPNLGCSILWYFTHSPLWASFFRISDQNLWKYLFPWGKIWP